MVPDPSLTIRERAIALDQLLLQLERLVDAGNTGMDHRRCRTAPHLAMAHVS